MTTIAEELRAQGLKQGLQQGREQGLQQGREQGLQQGREQGLQQGREQGLARQRQTLERQMTRKFGPLPEPVIARIQAADVDLLDRWFERVLTADSPDAVVEL